MVPFEPKTDSKEFEIANPEQSPATGSRIAASEAADLTIRVWRRDTSGGTAALTWNSESVLVYMITDLVAASHGRTAAETPAAMAAHFNNSLQALVAAKRIQTAILEFLACRPGDYLGAAVLIHPPVTEGFSQGMAQSALRLTEPGQIILSEEVSRRFQDIPGIELRAVPALTTGGTEHAGLAELVWTSAEQLASLRNSAAVAPPTVDLGPPVGATMIVNAPKATPRRDAAASERMDTASRKPPATDGLRNREGAFEEGLAEFEERSAFITRSRMVIGAVAIVLVVVALVLFHPWSSSNLSPKSPASDTPAATPTVETPTGNVPQPPPVAQPVTEPPAKPLPPAAKKTGANKTPVDKTAKDIAPKKPEDTPIVGFEGNSTYDGMTQKDILRLLQWARSDAGNGNYAKAAQEYRVILQLQPNNPDAREGLRKIQVAQQRDQ